MHVYRGNWPPKMVLTASPLTAHSLLYHATLVESKIVHKSCMHACMHIATSDGSRIAEGFLECKGSV